MQLPLLVPLSTWKTPRVADLPSWEGAKRVAIDVETNDLTLKQLGPGVRRGAYITGFSFAIEDGPKYYVPLRHDGGDNVEDPLAALGWFREQAKNFTGEIVGANLNYDLDFLAEVEVIFPRIKFFRDVQILEPLIDELQMSYSLETICNKYLGIGKNEGVLREAANAYGIDPKKDMWKLPARFVGEYAEQDAALPLQVLRRQERIAEEQELFPIYDMESKLLPVLVKMRRLGVRVDLDKLALVEQWSVAQERVALAEIKRITGCEIPFNSVWQATALVPALLQIGAKIPLTPKTKKPSIDKVFLNSIKHPVGEAILRARRVNKIRTTFAQSIRDHIIGDRIHCTIHQLRSSDEDDEDGEGTGARYGRCSSQNPNMQQQPARDPEIGPMWRGIFIPEENELWCSADFSSQEPRQAVHYANKVKLGFIKVQGKWVDADESARNMAATYTNDLKTDPHQALANIIMGREATKDERFQAKTIFLGLSYGMGGAKLCRQLGLPTIFAVRDPNTGEVADSNTEWGKTIVSRGGKIFEAAGVEGQALLNKFDQSVPFVRALNKICAKAAAQYGYIRTESGRKCRFPKDDLGNIMDSHKAMNRIVQGGSADQTKKVMIALYEEGIPMHFPVHDELCLSIANKEAAERIVQIMQDAYKLCVPNKIDCEIGISWGEAH